MNRTLSLPILVSLFAACGTSSNPPATVEDTGTDAPAAADAPELDAANGQPSDVYPAVPANLPQIIAHGAAVVKSPEIVTVTWSDDPDPAEVEAFGDALGGSSYWHTITSEYGVGPATSGAANHIRISTPPPAKLIVDSTTDDVAQFMIDHTADGTMPPPSANRVYVVYLSPAIDFQLNGSSCGYPYHSAATESAAGKRIVYAIIPKASCLKSRTASASHELGEAVTDPRYPLGLTNFDPQHLGWSLLMSFNEENGDACEYEADAFYKETEPGLLYQVQRQWSNAAAALGHNPCVPARDEPYFNVAPRDLEPLTVTLDPATTPPPVKRSSLGYVVAVGDTKTVVLDLFSDAKTDDWTLSVVEGNGLNAKSWKDLGHLELTLDLAHGRNGMFANLGVKVLSAGAKHVELLTVVSTSSSGTKHFLPLVIGTP